jgi:hypothetical protein
MQFLFFYHISIPFFSFNSGQGGTYSTNGGDIKCTRFNSENFKGRDNFGKLGINGRKI